MKICLCGRELDEFVPKIGNIEAVYGGVNLDAFSINRKAIFQCAGHVRFASFQTPGHSISRNSNNEQHCIDWHYFSYNAVAIDSVRAAVRPV